MAVPIQPRGEYIVVEQEKKTEVKTKSGLYIAAGSAKEDTIAKVLAVGKDVKNIKVGDKVIYKSYSTTEVKLEYGGTQYLLVKEEDILATVA
jgi:chaperonin GroES